MDKANGENKSPSRQFHFLLQKNNGKNERQIMTSKEAMSLALFGAEKSLEIEQERVEILKKSLHIFMEPRA
ncbi:MAG: hypothetical protein K6G88_10860 [Lachnospiraceae bacterium]|nr:hypothetical protein [Lachnospiraceae bacterium]